MNHDSDMNLPPSDAPAAYLEVAPSELTAASVSGASAQELPMMVWLRGDEDICSDFSLDADAVMQRLGIRRSRLTQISGRELRVGRMRKGRYVSPVFRPEDVEAYLNWTRASASHLKSSGLLHDAAGELMQQSARLSDRFETVPQELQALGEVLQHRIDKIDETTAELLARFDADQVERSAKWQQLEAGLVASDSRLEQRLAEQTSLLESFKSQLDAHQLLLHMITREVGEVAAGALLQKADWQELQQGLLASQEALRLDLGRDLRDELVAAIELQGKGAVKSRPASLAASRRIRALSLRDAGAGSGALTGGQSQRSLKSQARAKATGIVRRRSPR
jgi:hypothetical protein